ncbi:MAG: hypothetical protein CYPHOPRED_000280 [Cyphobasidiales sp. Tagirdzhanova-0007]|nr:MAG: hypothetical protein CYPHOPRED_000280 [Cyphobasidiales sp. Tagirdzhanova-0007]
MEAAQTATAAPSLFKRQSSSSPSRRSGSSHRSPALAAQPEDSLPRRFSNHNDEQSKLMYCMEADEELLYAMEAEVEAEEELLVDSLSRKLEKLRADKVELESTLSMEQELLVNRLQRQLSQLLTTQQQIAQPNTSLPSSPTAQDLPLDPSSHIGINHRASTSSIISAPNLAPSNSDPAHPSAFVILDALQIENNSLRNRLADAESTATHASRVNEVYRQELIELRGRAGLNIEDLNNPARSPLELYDSYSAGNSSAHLRRSSNPQGNSSAEGIRIPGVPGVSQSPPPHSRSISKSSYSPSFSSALSPSTPYSVSPATVVTTPSTSYTMPHAPASTPTNYGGVSLPTSSLYSSMSSTPYGSTTSSSSTGGPAVSYRVPPPSLASSVGKDSALATSPYARSASPVSGMDTPGSPGALQKRLSSSRHGARIAETGVLKQITTSSSSGRERTCST